MQRSPCFGAFVAFVLCVVVVPAARAADRQPPDPAKIFAKKDANGDGTLTLEEFKAGLKDKALEVADKRFKKIDSNGDGTLSLDEFRAGRPQKK